ncbi:MAG: Rho termination factor N-terminal domain-containing protein [Deltaproteobacteria bacterium]|nr:Rho termination factor N-terminal domain-containing protein [Deltaproteobacteria bacterium]
MPSVKYLKDMAQKLGVEKFSRLKKADLVRAIQSAEGHKPCYEQIVDCAQNDCLFWGDCQEGVGD